MQERKHYGEAQQGARVNSNQNKILSQNLEA